MLTTYLLPVLFLFQLAVCEAIFLVKAPKRTHFALRAALSASLYMAAAIGLNLLFGVLPQTIPLRIVFFLLFFSGSVPAIYAMFDIQLPHVIFVAIAGYSVQHVTDSVLKIFLQLVDLSAVPLLLRYLTLLIFPYIGGALLFYVFVVRPALQDDKIQFGDRRVLIISAINIVMCLVLSVVMDDTVQSIYGIIIGKIYAILGCMLCLFLQAGIFQMGKMEQINTNLHNMMEIERRQHQISKETIELINMKCHDLKHQLNKLESMSAERRSRHIARLSEAVMIYDSMIKTGNDALDMVLMEKKLLCDKYNIHFSFLGDAAPLSMMEEVDIYSLFGNMLDNAIESLQHEPDEEKRVMTLNIITRHDMIYVCMDNYFSTPVMYENGALQTTKQQEPGMHGYGIRSIEYIVNTYNGSLLIRTDYNHFVLQIMLPQGEAA